MERKFDAVVVGDALIDTFLHIDGEGKHYHLDRPHNEVSFELGAKIVLDSCTFCLGGNACNVSVGLSRQGHKIALVAELGEDEFAKKITKGLHSEKVSLDYCKQTPGAQSTFSVGLNVGNDRTLFIHHVERRHDLHFQGLTTDWIYLTSLGEDWKGLYAKVLEYLKKHPETKLAFNPGSHQMKAGYAAFKDVVSVADILFVNREEAEEMLYGKIPTKEERETEENILFRMLRMGPKLIVMTDGQHGSFAMDSGGTFFHHGIYKDVVVEKTGAGDGFASGFLGAILSGKDIKTAMQWGSANSSSVITQVGGQAGLLSVEKIEEKIRENI